MLVANYPQMNFTQMHERLRLELLRRIQRGTLSVSLLARQTGFGQPHLSNFLHSRRQLSLEGMDRILAAQHLAARRSAARHLRNQSHCRPTGKAARSRSSPMRRRSLSHSSGPQQCSPCCTFPQGCYASFRTKTSNPRRAWQRFVAVRIPRDRRPADGAVWFCLKRSLLLDRHYNSLMPYRCTAPTSMPCGRGRT